ncbi:MAG TPA: hypothetical protein VFA32_04880 [Dehalococcoidia bacterium]|nr:hypothetical protein [Dehalococcoidia bacterium]
MQQPQQTERERGEAYTCYWHPSVETGLSCSRCGKHICPQCMVQAPVGIRCKECGKAIPTPTYDVRPTFYARGVAVAAGVAIGGGVIWSVLVNLLGGIPFLPVLIALGVGYAAGELISLSVNRKRSLGLAWLAGGSVVIAFLISWLTSPFNFSLLGLLFIILGVVLAVQKVRP